MWVEFLFRFFFKSGPLCVAPYLWGLAHHCSERRRLITRYCQSDGTSGKIHRSKENKITRVGEMFVGGKHLILKASTEKVFSSDVPFLRIDHPIEYL